MQTTKIHVRTSSVPGYPLSFCGETVETVPLEAVLLLVKLGTHHVCPECKWLGSTEAFVALHNAALPA